MPFNPKSLANLKSAKPGDVLNPKGRPRNPAGASVREWINELQEKTEKELEKIASDEKAKANKRVAARLWLGALKDGWTKKGTRLAAADFDRIMDRTQGKPAQQVNMQHSGELNIKRVVLEKRRSDE